MCNLKGEEYFIKNLDINGIKSMLIDNIILSKEKDNNSSEDADYKVLNGDVEVDVYIDSYGRISKLDYDFSGLVSGIDKFTCSMVLSKYNEAGDVMIPPSIKANAQEAK